MHLSKSCMNELLDQHELTILYYWHHITIMTCILSYQIALLMFNKGCHFNLNDTFFIEFLEVVVIITIKRNV